MYFPQWRPQGTIINIIYIYIQNQLTMYQIQYSVHVLAQCNMRQVKLEGFLKKPKFDTTCTCTFHFFFYRNYLRIHLKLKNN